MARFNPGDRVLLREGPLFGVLTVDRVRSHFGDEPDPNGPVWCQSNNGRWGFLASYDQAELVACPPEYEFPPPAAEHWLALRWLCRNRALLNALHGAGMIARTERHIRDRIKLNELINDALAAEPDAGAMRQAEIAFGEVGRLAKELK